MITATATLTETISVTASLGGSVCLAATYTLVDTDVPPNTLDSGSIASGAAATIVAPAATVTVNTAPFGTAPSGGGLNVPVVNGGSNTVGSKQGSDWVIDNNATFINGTQVTDQEAEVDANIFVTLNGAQSGTWNAGLQTWEVTSPPCADATFSIDGTQVDTIASGADLDVSVELNGSPVTPTYNSGTKVIGVTGGVSGSIAVAVSNATPTFGQSITITATPTGFTPTNYIFFAYDGANITWIAEQAGAAVNWTVSMVGAFEVYALGTDGALEVYGLTNVTAASALVCDSITTAPVAGFSVARRLSINYLGDAMLIRRSSDNATLSIGFIGEAVDTAAITTFVGVGNGFTARIFDQVGSNNPEQLTAGMQPSIVISGSIQLLSGKPTVVFDGSTDEMTIPSAITFRHGFIVAAKSSNTNGLQYLVGGTGQGLTMGGTILPQIAAVTAGGNLISAIDNTARHQISIRLGVAGAGRLQVDGVTQATGTTSATMLIDRIGTRPDVAFRHIGACSELIFYTNALSDADNLILNNNQLAYYP